MSADVELLGALAHALMDRTYRMPYSERDEAAAALRRLALIERGLRYAADHDHRRDIRDLASALLENANALEAS